MPTSPQARRSLSWYAWRMPLTNFRCAAGFKLFLTALPGECACPESDPPLASSVSGFLPAVAATRSSPARRTVASNCRTLARRPHFAAHLADLLAGFHLPQRVQIFSSLCPFRGIGSPPTLRSENHTSAQSSTFPLSHFLGFGSTTRNRRNSRML